MTSIHVVPDRQQQYIGLGQAHMLYRIGNSIIGTPSSSRKRRYDTSCKYTAIRNFVPPQPVDLTPIPQLLPYMQSFLSFGQHVIYQVPNIAKEIQNNRSLYIISLTYIHTTNRQQNTQTQYPRHAEIPGINMTQATTTAVLKTQQMYTTSKHNTNTSTDVIISC